MHKIVQPDGWKEPKGYANGVLAQGATLYIGGQIGWNEDQVFVAKQNVFKASENALFQFSDLNTDRTVTGAAFSFGRAGIAFPVDNGHGTAATAALYKSS